MEALAVLADDTRRTIVEALAVEEQCVGDLVARFQLTQPAISQHLKVLRQAGLVEVRAEAQRRFYRLNALPLLEVDQWLAQFRRFWAGRLDSLEQYLDANPERPEAHGDGGTPTRAKRKTAE